MTIEEMKREASELHSLLNSGGEFEVIGKRARDLLEIIARHMINNSVEQGNEIILLQAQVRITLAITFFKRGLLRETGEVVDEVLAETGSLDSAEAMTLQARALGMKGNIHIRKGENKSALEYYKRSLELFTEVGDTKSIARSISNIGVAYQEMFEYEKALEYHEKALATETEAGNAVNIAMTLGNIGGVHNELSNFSLSLDYYLRAIELLEKTENKDDLARQYGSIGNVFKAISDYPSALQYYTSALTLNRKIGNLTGIANDLSNIGLVYHNIDNDERALEYLTEALAINEDIGRPIAIAQINNSIGNVYLTMENYPKALEWYGTSLQISEELDNAYGIAVNIGDIGNVYMSMKDYSRALEYYLRALAADGDIDNKEGVTRHLFNIGALYSRIDYEGFDAALAEEYLLKSLAQGEEMGVRQIQFMVNRELGALYKHLNRWQESLAHFEKFHELYVLVHSDETQEQTRLLEHRRKVEEAERDRQIKLARFQEQEKILHKTLPPVIADRLIAGEKDIADRYESVSILFADIVGFTPLSTRLSPREVVHILNDLFSRFDRLTEKYGVERIKTIGDAYMIVAGAPEVVDDHALRLAQTAFGMLEETADFNAKSGYSIALRIGVNSGEAIAAVVGDVKFSYDLWSDAVNTASRMESHGEAGKIHCTEEFVRALSLLSFQSFQSLKFVERGEMHIKGKGKMTTYFLEQHRETIQSIQSQPYSSEHGTRRTPNKTQQS